MFRFTRTLCRLALAVGLSVLPHLNTAGAQSWYIEPSSPGLSLPGMPMEYDLYRGGSRVGRLEESMPGLSTPGIPQEFDVYSRSGRRIGTAEIDRSIPGFPDATLRFNGGGSRSLDLDDDD